MRRWLALIALPALLCQGRLPCAAASDPRRINEVKEAFARRDFPEARQLIEAQLMESPDDPDWRLWRAEVSARLGRLTDALAQVREIIAAQPRHRPSRLREGQLLSELGRLSAASEVYWRCLDDFPEDADVLAGLGLVSLWRGEYGQASELFDRALRAQPASESAWYGRLRTWMAEGRTLPAWIEAQTRDQESGGRDAELGFLLANLAQRIGAGEVALTLASRPTTDGELQFRQRGFRARELVRRGEFARAMALVDSLERVNPPDYDALIQAADVLALADRREAARSIYERAVQLTPERPEARLGLARLASREGRLVGSLVLYRDLIHDNPESLEAWLGVVRTAQLMDDLPALEEALTAAQPLAPRSALLHRERLKAALFAGDITAFDERLARYLADQPDDREGQLWRQRRLALTDPKANGERVDLLLDPFSPVNAACGVRLWLNGGGDLDECLARMPRLGDAGLRHHADEALGGALALLLHRAAALRVVAPPGDNTGPSIGVMAAGWWAYVSTPFAHAAELRPDFDEDALAVWLAGEIQRRLRTLQVETESPLWDEWLLARAAWFSRWRDDPGSPAALADLRRLIHQFVPGWDRTIRLTEIDTAWRASDPSVVASEPYSLVLARARWRLYRHRYAQALEELRQLELEFPLAAEPLQRQAEILRVAGRWDEAEQVLRRAVDGRLSSPVLRLEHIDMLRRLGRLAEADARLEVLKKSGFDEPEWYLQAAAVAETRGDPETVERTYEQGLRRHPRARILLLGWGDWLVKRGRPEALAGMIQEDPSRISVEPDWMPQVAPWLDPGLRRQIEGSSQWWFTWRWLGWQRLSPGAARTLSSRAGEDWRNSNPDRALAILWPALTARLPDSELWLEAARCFDLTRQGTESARAYRLAMHLGTGRLDASILELTARARRDPLAAAREFARRLEETPDDRPLRLGLVQALLQAGQVAAADRALAPLIAENPADPDTRFLAAQVKTAQGRIREARSLQQSLLRQDPLAADPRAARQALRETDEFDCAAGFEYDWRRESTGDSADLPSWQQAFVSGLWHREQGQALGLAYYWYDRDGDIDQQLWLDLAQRFNREWLGRVVMAPGFGADYIARWRMGAGVSYTLEPRFVANFDLHYLDFHGLDVWQVVPGFTWRWHPHGTVDGRVYLGHNQLRGGRTRDSVTWALDAGWQIAAQSLLMVRTAFGDENSANPTADLIGNDRLVSVGVEWRLGWRHRWSVRPGYRYEAHQTFDLQALSISAGYGF